MNLSDVFLRNLKGTGTAQKHSDVGGLFIFVTPSGKKYWRMAYRFGGKQKLLSFGEYPLISLREVRDKRETAKKLLYDGVDPGEQKKAVKAAAVEAQKNAKNTFEAVAREWYPLKVRQVSEKQASRILHYLEANAFPVFGAKPVSEIEAMDVLGIIRPIEAKGHHTSADKVLSACSQVLDYAMNPTSSFGARY